MGRSASKGNRGLELMGLLNSNKSWAKNTRGGVKVSQLVVKRVRHDGVRCYGEHQGKRCWPYDFSREPAIPQGQLIPKPPDNCRCAGGTLLSSISICPVHSKEVMA